MKKLNKEWFDNERVALLVGGLIAGLCALGLITFVARGVEPPWVAAIIAGVGGILGVFAFILIGLAMLADEKPGHPGKDAFCARCGKKYAPKSQKAGFDRRTGKQRFQISWACPNSTDLSGDCSPSLTSTRFSWPMPTPVTSPSISTFNPNLLATWNTPCHDPAVASCGQCLDRMVAEGRLTEAEAALLR